MLYDSVRFFFIFVLSPHASAMSRIFVLDLGGGSLVTNTSCGSRRGAQRGPAPTPLFLDQNEARRADKKGEYVSMRMVRVREKVFRNSSGFRTILILTCS